MIRTLLALLLSAGYCAPAIAQPHPLEAARSAVTFRHASVVVDGVRLHYVVAGEGDPVVLLPGWPESWFAWRFVIPDLVRAGHKVYALDPRGFGDSDKPRDGYDPVTAARDLHEFILALGLNRGKGVDIVTHDVGTWIGFVHAATYPRDVRRLVLAEATLPGVSVPLAAVPGDAANVKTWQFGFNRLDDLPELLVAGHERVFLSWLFLNKSVRRPGIDAESVDEYVRVFSSPGGARAGFAYYRSFFTGSGLDAMRQAAGKRFAMPILTVGADGGVGQALSDTMKPLATDLRGSVIRDCGHYIADECPADFSRAILDFWASSGRGTSG
jgi:pimeloyl-ACP methyl ester carboxylesterase